MTPLPLALLLALAPQVSPGPAPPSAPRRPPIPTFTPTPTATPTPTPVPPRATPVPTPRLSSVARDRKLASSGPAGARFVFPQPTHRRWAGVVSVSGWLTNAGSAAACDVAIRVSVVDAKGRLVGSATGPPRSPNLAPGHGSPWELSVPVPKPFEDDPDFRIGSASASVVSYSGDCRE